MKAGIVICSRLESSRVPNKAVRLLNGVPLIQHLVLRVAPTGIPIVVAVPPGEADRFRVALGDLSSRVHLLEAFADDPLLRMHQAAEWLGLDVVIRITHDKIFVNPSDILRFLDIYSHSEIDYLYSSDFVAGTGFEVIKSEVLAKAAEKFRKVEHISYAIRALTKQVSDIPTSPVSNHRLLIDYPEDVVVMNQVLGVLGNDCSIYEALKYLDQNAHVSRMNRTPLVTVYTCAYNANPDWLDKAMMSVVHQNGFDRFEYLLIDDGSTDDTTAEAMNSLSCSYQNVHLHCMEKNGGLASACNFALGLARGKYVVRLDADDWFLDNAVMEMVAAMESGCHDILYPDYYVGTGAWRRIGKGFECNHVGGTMFSTRALNYVKFTDGLRGYEGYDLFERAKEQLRIGYLDRPMFYYRQHDASLSKEDPEKRLAIKKEIEERLGK